MQNASSVSRECGSFYVMPPSIRESSPEAKRAWVIGVFAGVAGSETAELKDVVAERGEKVYEKLEIHHHSPQLYAVMAGAVAVPVSSAPEADEVTFYRVNEGEALVVGQEVWHGGPVGLDGAAKVIVALREGTTNGDTRKQPVSPAVRFNPVEG